MLRRISIILIVAVLLPSTVLAFLAIRSLKDQQIVLERQQGLLYQEVIDGLALRIDAFMQNLQNRFALEVDEMLAGEEGPMAPRRFNRLLREDWPLAKVGFVVDRQGALLSPLPGHQGLEQKFLDDNRSFFANTQELAVYNQVRPLTSADVDRETQALAKRSILKEGKVTFLAKWSRQRKAAANPETDKTDDQSADTVLLNRAFFQIETREEFNYQPEVELPPSILAPAQEPDLFGAEFTLEDEGALPQEEVLSFREGLTAPSSSQLASVASKSRAPRMQQSKVKAAPISSATTSKQTEKKGIKEKSFGKTTQATVRTVSPSQRFDDQPELLSKVQPEYTAFQSLVGDQRQGAYARYLQDELSVFFWYRPPADDSKIFGVELSMSVLRQRISQLLDESETKSKDEMPIALAILDEKAMPVAVVPAEFSADWRHPFVASELGERIEILPHWEVAAYLLNPAQLQQAAANLRWSLGSIIGLMLFAVALGGFVLWRDLKREIIAARQKTDFVSNVSHELKTPLTSIRMFSELLRRQGEEAKRQSPENQQRYLDIIIAEASRLTRLINNILDFSRMEQARKQYRLADFNLSHLTEEIVSAYRAHLQENGYTLELVGAETPLLVKADRDAITQVILNLISNAEKYGGEEKQIRVELSRGKVPAQALIRVLDRGEGVPRGHESQIFKKFYRAHDSLSSGIQGSGLGLTLAFSIAQAHGGTLRYQKREGGGACFTLVLPLKKEGDEAKI